jgi:hypothetical protein
MSRSYTASSPLRLHTCAMGMLYLFYNLLCFERLREIVKMAVFLDIASFSMVEIY